MLLLQCDFNVLKMSPPPLAPDSKSGGHRLHLTKRKLMTSKVSSRKLKKLLPGCLGTLALFTQPLCGEEAKQPHGKAILQVFWSMAPAYRQHQLTGMPVWAFDCLHPPLSGAKWWLWNWDKLSLPALFKRQVHENNLKSIVVSSDSIGIVCYELIDDQKRLKWPSFSLWPSQILPTFQSPVPISPPS